MSTRSVAISLFCPLIAILGCSDQRPQRFPVSGHVTIDGKPLTKGVVCVLPSSGRQASGHIQSDGSFQLTTFELNDGCVAGEHPMQVLAFDFTNDEKSRVWHVPTRYGNYRTSGLSLKVDQPVEDTVIKLRWNGEQPVTEVLEK